MSRQWAYVHLLLKTMGKPLTAVSDPPCYIHLIFFKHPISPQVAERQHVLDGIIIFSLGVMEEHKVWSTNTWKLNLVMSHAVLGEHVLLHLYLVNSAIMQNVFPPDAEIRGKNK